MKLVIALAAGFAAGPFFNLLPRQCPAPAALSSASSEPVPSEEARIYGVEVPAAEEPPAINLAHLDEREAAPARVASVEAAPRPARTMPRPRLIRVPSVSQFVDGARVSIARR